LRSFTVLPDTGGADFWVPAVNPGGEIFDPSKSTTYIDLQRNVQISYSSGTVLAKIGTDIVHIGGLKTAKDQTFGIVSNVPSGMPSGGNLGLGFKELSATGTLPVFQKLVEDRLVDAPVFAFSIDKVGIIERYNLALGGTDSNFYYEPFIDVLVSQKVGFFIISPCSDR
jgi:hypothetical protein